MEHTNDEPTLLYNTTLGQPIGFSLKRSTLTAWPAWACGCGAISMYTIHQGNTPRIIDYVFSIETPWYYYKEGQFIKEIFGCQAGYHVRMLNIPELSCLPCLWSTFEHTQSLYLS